MKRLKDILTDIQSELSKANTAITVGMTVMNNDQECKYYHSMGVVEGIDTFTEPMGLVVAYRTTNSGPHWEKGQILKKDVKHLVATDFSNDDTRNTEYNNLPLIAEEHNEYMNMVLTALKAIGVHAKTIYNSVDDPQIMQNLTEPWVLGKIAVVAEQMRSIRDFVIFSSGPEQKDSPHADSSDQPIINTEQSGAGKPGLWDNIRKKKEREGKNYKPAKPGDKDRPDPDQWKKLTK